MFRIQERVDQVVLANNHATILAEAPNGVLGSNNKLAGCEVIKLDLPPNNPVGDLSEVVA